MLLCDFEIRLECMKLIGIFLYIIKKCFFHHCTVSIFTIFFCFFERDDYVRLQIPGKLALHDDRISAVGAGGGGGISVGGSRRKGRVPRARFQAAGGFSVCVLRSLPYAERGVRLCRFDDPEL